MRTRFLPTLAAPLASLLLAAPVAADCEPAGPLADVLPTAPVAFVATVTAVEGSLATFAVADVWAGNVDAQAQVHGLAGGGEGLPAPLVEDDRTWTVGREYLVLPDVHGGLLVDHICTATTEWDPALAELRPADARIVAAPQPAGIPVAVPLVAAVVLFVLVASVVAFRRS
jgi:hypothetical protein